MSRRPVKKMTKSAALAEIRRIIEAVDQRCAAADGPVTPTLQEMTQDEISRIYRLARGPHNTNETRKRPFRADRIAAKAAKEGKV